MFSFPYTYATQSYKNSYGNIVLFNDEPTVRPTYKYEIYSQHNYFTQEPTEALIPTPFPTKYIQPELPIKNFTCICEFNNNENIKLIIAASVSSTLCFILFGILFWYRFIFKKQLFKWQTNEVNFGFGL